MSHTLSPLGSQGEGKTWDYVSSEAAVLRSQLLDVVGDGTADVGNILVAEARDKIIRKADGTAYYVDGNLGSHWIPRSGTYNWLIPDLWQGSNQSLSVASARYRSRHRWGVHCDPRESLSSLKGRGMSRASA